MSFTLNCWHCHNDFEYDPPKILADRNHPAEFYQGSTVCKDCTPCMGHNGKCKHYDVLGQPSRPRLASSYEVFTSPALDAAADTYIIMTEALC